MYNIVIGFGIHKQLLKLIKYVYITPIAIYGHANLCLICFILRMIHKMERFYHHCFSTLLQNMPVGRSKQITSCYNSTVHIRSLFMLTMLIYGVKVHTPYASSVHCKDTGLEVNVEKLKICFCSTNSKQHKIIIHKHM